jgi:RimJ/RimL family protein N-acetyltransferase
VDRLETARLILRPFAAADAPRAHRVYSDPRVMRYVATGAMEDIAVTERLLHDYEVHQHMHGFSFWAVIERASGELIGDAGLYRTPAGEVELGYTLGLPWWGRGYATEAAGAWIEAAFSTLGIDEVVALAEPANYASLHVLEKLGMQRTGERLAFGRPHAVYRRGRASQFTYRETRDGLVLVSWRGRVVTRLAGRGARKLLERVRGAPPERVQHELARVTGNFKRGNEQR